MGINIFISYSSADSNKKDALKRAITKRKGLKAIIVEDYRSNGIEFTEKVANDIKRSNYFVPILTATNYQRSQWLNQEIGFAFATFTKDKICPIVSRNIISKLKGFIHNQADIPYNFQGNKEVSKERSSFRKCIKLLLDDITEKERLDEETGLTFQTISKIEYDQSKIPLNLSLKNSLPFKIRIKLSDTQQILRFYFRILTNKNEMYWIGYTNMELPADGHITLKENTQQISSPNKLEYNLGFNLKKEIENRFNMTKKIKGILIGDPVAIELIAFRGDKNIHDPIHYYFNIIS